VTVSTPVLSSMTTVILHSAHPTSAPSSVPSCAAGSFGEKTHCGQCPPGKYSSIGGQSECTQCPVGTYSDAYGLLTCKKCPWPSYTSFEGQTVCGEIYLMAPFYVWSGLIGFLGLIFLSGIYFVDAEFRMAVFLIMAFPAMDICSDLVYIITNPFISPTMFLLVLASFILPNFMFVWKLYEVGAVPFTVRYYPGFSFGIKSLFWLGRRSSYPTIDGNLSPGVFKEYNDLGKIFLLFVLWIVLIVLQLMNIFGFVLWMIITSPLILLTFIIGIICFQTKVLAVKYVYFAFMFFWTGNDERFAPPKNFKIDPALLNETIFAEFMFETMPQCMFHKSLKMNNYL